MLLAYRPNALRAMLVMGLVLVSGALARDASAQLPWPDALPAAATSSMGSSTGSYTGLQDGGWDTMWMGSQTRRTGDWVRLDLGAIKEVTRYLVYAGTCVNGPPTHGRDTIAIGLDSIVQYSVEGEEWASLPWTQHDGTDGFGCAFEYVDHTLTLPVRARYLRILSWGNGTSGWAANINEFHAFGRTPDPAPPVMQQRPAVSGAPGLGETARCDRGAWSGDPVSYRYEWFRDGVQLDGETGDRHVVTQADVDRRLMCRVQAFNAGGGSERQRSAERELVTSYLPATATSNAGSSRFPLTHAVDDRDATMWTASRSATDGDWLQLDLGEVKTVARYRYFADGRCENSPYLQDDNLKGWNIVRLPAHGVAQSSADGVTWTTLPVNPAWARASECEGALQDVELALPVQARYLRVVATMTLSTGWSWSVNELQAYESTAAARPTAPGGPDPLGLPAPAAPAVAAEEAVNAGSFTLRWDAVEGATGYAVERHDAATGAWERAAEATSPSVDLADQPEGRLAYRVRATADGAVGEPSAPSEAVTIDRTAPRPPSAELAAPAWSDGGTDWYRDRVSGRFADAGDPPLADGSDGSGTVSVTEPFAFEGEGTHAVAGRSRDAAGNLSEPTRRDLRVDASAPTVSLECPATVQVGATAEARVDAADLGAGLVAQTPTAVSLDTATAGVRTATVTVTDRVGHSASASCTYAVKRPAPSAPRLTTGATPGDGAIGLTWDVRDGGSAPEVSVVELRDADDTEWRVVHRGAGLTWSTAAAPLAEGTYRIRVRAEDETFDPAPSAELAPVVVDRTAPPAPSIAPDRTAEQVVAAEPDWWRDSVTLTFATQGDPALADGSAGSGVDPTSLPAARTFATLGTHTATGTVRDRAGNTSPVASSDVRVDTTTPVASIRSCPPNAVTAASTANATYSATDTGSGLVGSTAGTFALDTFTGGTRTAAYDVRDLVGHVARVTCSYRVEYAWLGFGAPLDEKTQNVVRLGTAVPIRFALGGTQATGFGLGVLATPPALVPASCPNKRTTISETLPADAPTLALDPVTKQYTARVTVPSDPALVGTCQAVVIRLVDGREQRVTLRIDP